MIARQGHNRVLVGDDDDDDDNDNNNCAQRKKEKREKAGERRKKMRRRRGEKVLNNVPPFPWHYWARHSSYHHYSAVNELHLLETNGRKKIAFLKKNSCMKTLGEKTGRQKEKQNEPKAKTDRSP